jgi:hypothetical protein
MRGFLRENYFNLLIINGYFYFLDNAHKVRVFDLILFNLT